MKSNCIILKLGGSLVVPKEIDVNYLKRFRALIIKHVKAGTRFVIIAGGGYTNRWYRDRAEKLGVKNITDLHWIGTIATQLNAEFIRTLFGPLAHPRTYCNFAQKISWEKPILIVGGYEPGHSTNLDAVLMARKFRSRTTINLTDVDSLYIKDPKKFKDAQPIREITWQNYLKMFNNQKRHLPGQHIPIDVVAARSSQKYKIETFYIGGNNFKNLDKLLSGKSWKGTRIY